MVLLRVHDGLAVWLGGSGALLFAVVSILLTGVLGAALARSQGVRVLNRINASLQKGEIPAGSMIEGVLVLTGGVLLLTPGYVTDVLGLSFLFPLSRIAWRRALLRWLQTRAERGELIFQGHVVRTGAAPRPMGHDAPRPSGGVIDLSPEEFDDHSRDRP